MDFNLHSDLGLDLPVRGGSIVFAATGILRTTGGIQSANRNVLYGLGALAARTGAKLKTLVMHEDAGADHDTGAHTHADAHTSAGAGGRPQSIPQDGRNSGLDFTEATFAGQRVPMAVAIVRALLSARLVVFDHVDLARPLALMGRVPRPLRAKTAILAHGSESWKRIKPVSIHAYRAADRVLTNSNYTLAHMQRTFDGFEGVAVPLGLAPQYELSPSPPPRRAQRPTLMAADGIERPISDRAMLLVGRLDAGEREKGHRELMAALPQVQAKVPDAQLVFVGAGSDLEPLRAEAAASGVASAIFLTGRADDATLNALYGAAYAYVMPSRQEGFGLVYLEAMNHALPCLACHRDGAADVVADGETGILIDQPIVIDQLAAALTDLLSNPEGARQMGVAGWRRLNAEFTPAAHQARVAHALAPLLL